MASDPLPLSAIEGDKFPDPLALRKQALSEKVAADVLALFKISVIAMTGLTILMAAVDAAFILLSVIKPTERLVTESVLMSVIGATIVQVGAASLAIVYALFRREGALTE